MLAAHGQESPSDDRVGVYLELLGDEDPRHVAEAIKRAIADTTRNTEFPPTPGTVQKHLDQVRRESHDEAPPLLELPPPGGLRVDVPSLVDWLERTPKDCPEVPKSERDRLVNVSANVKAYRIVRARADRYGMERGDHYRWLAALRDTESDTGDVGIMVRVWRRKQWEAYSRTERTRVQRERVAASS